MTRVSPVEASPPARDRRCRPYPESDEPKDGPAPAPAPARRFGNRATRHPAQWPSRRPPWTSRATPPPRPPCDRRSRKPARADRCRPATAPARKRRPFPPERDRRRTTPGAPCESRRVRRRIAVGSAPAGRRTGPNAPAVDTRAGPRSIRSTTRQAAAAPDSAHSTEAPIRLLPTRNLPQAQTIADSKESP